MEYYLKNRKQRLTPQIRNLVADVVLTHKKFIQPIFVKEGQSEKQVIPSLPHVYQDSEQSILQTIEADLNNGIESFLLFCNLEHKQDIPDNFSFQEKIIAKIKTTFKNDIFLITDLCLCNLTLHGHCGILNDTHDELDNQKSVELLSEIALIYAKAGADAVAPSDMNDGTIKALNTRLAASAMSHVILMAYSTKFFSNLYGPFRDACDSTPNLANQFKTRASYQIDYRNKKDAILTSMTDMQDGADWLMVKPAIYYLDIIKELKTRSLLPLVSYHVSGEYASLELLAKEGLGVRSDLHLEAWAALTRAGSDAIISYAARHAKQWLA